jgi:predicted acylesterase/phospholipase RssA
MILQELERLLAESGTVLPVASCFDLIAGTSTGGLISLALASPSDRLSLDFADDEVKEKEPNTSRRTPLEILDRYKLRVRQFQGQLYQEREQEELRAEEYAANHHQKTDSSNYDILPGNSSPFKRFVRFVSSRNRSSKEQAVAQESVDLSKILNIYEERGEDIFPKNTFRQLQSIGQVFSDKYSESSLESLLYTIFSDLTMREAVTPVFVTTVDCYGGKPHIISSFGKEDYYMRDAARATSAAPTYFSPLILSPLNDQDRTYCFIDGGVAANNPALLAYLEAKKIYPNASKYHILSLGTASKKFSLSTEQEVRGGVIGWLDPAKGTPLYSVMRSSQSGIIDYALDSLPDVDYYRIDTAMKQHHIRLDDASRDNINLLKQIGFELIREYRDTLKGFCSLLSGD